MAKYEILIHEFATRRFVVEGADAAVAHEKAMRRYVEDGEDGELIDSSLNFVEIYEE